MKDSMITLEQFKKTERKTIRTYTWGRFLIDVEDDQDRWRAWIYHPQYGIKEEMFGVFKKDTSYDGFLTMVLNNAMFDAYQYREQYIDVESIYDETEEDVREEGEA